MTTDERVLNGMTGHASSAMRTNVYQQKERPEVLEKTAMARDAVRDLAMAAAGAAKAKTP